VAGHFGETARSVAAELLVAGRVTILATDAHNASHRPPELKPGVRAAAELIGNRRAAELVTRNPWQLAKGHFE
jgi:protein-tyrosine phosphatase